MAATDAIANADASADLVAAADMAALEDPDKDAKEMDGTLLGVSENDAVAAAVSSADEDGLRLALVDSVCCDDELAEEKREIVGAGVKDSTSAEASGEELADFATLPVNLGERDALTDDVMDADARGLVETWADLVELDVNETERVADADTDGRPLVDEDRESALDTEALADTVADGEIAAENELDMDLRGEAVSELSRVLRALTEAEEDGCNEYVATIVREFSAVLFGDTELREEGILSAEAVENCDETALVVTVGVVKAEDDTTPDSAGEADATDDADWVKLMRADVDPL